MKFRSNAVLATLAVLAISAAVSQAALVTYTITSSSTALTSVSGVSGETGITASTDLTRGSDLTSAGATNSFSSTGWDNLSANDYYEFGLTVQAGYSASLTTITFNYTSSNTGPANMAVYSGATLLGTFTSANSVVPVSINASTLGAITGTVTFQIRAVDAVAVNAGAVASAGTSRIRDSLVIDGTVTAVPEPASAVLGAVGLLGLLRRRR